MLKLVFDIKCGYEKFYLIEKDAEFPLGFLTDKKIFDSNNKNKDLQYLDEEELFYKYIAVPEQLVKDYGLFEVIRSVISLEYYSFCFKTFKREEKPFFPELFTLENVRLIGAELKSAEFNDDNFDDFSDNHIVA